MYQRQIVLIAHNLRSCHNVGSLLRTAEGLGVEAVYLTGYTPYPLSKHDTRLPHMAQKIDKQISKTALGAEKFVKWHHNTSVEEVVRQLRAEDYTVVALEQTPASRSLPSFTASGKIAIVLGREVEGMEPEVLALCNLSLEIPMFGKKESFNVVQAAAMALYHCRFLTH
jgi:23S rRNA (guanosine2251-2'-O)-methyltransferase